MMKTKLLFI